MSIPAGYAEELRVRFREAKQQYGPSGSMLAAFAGSIMGTIQTAAIWGDAGTVERCEAIIAAYDEIAKEPK